MKNGTKRVERRQFIVAVPENCHGKPAFKSGRVMVWRVLEDVAERRAWELIRNVWWGGRIPPTALAKAVRRRPEAQLDTQLV